ncbi:VOC family protein [Actinokineospora enzanensis]|uniref:VOC family protein n=1 Tax=Actinokineospora enzanensis TaxID=155975 RepID=UPI00036F72FB|nr:VOC family protein [Actinokineospora enzanensis]
MPTRLVNVVVDARDPATLARFWADLLGWEITQGDATEVDVTAPAMDGWPLDLTFVPVSDPKTSVNPLHLDLPSISPTAQAALVTKALSLGASHVDIGQGEAPWVVLADPEGNEFCALDPRPEYADTGAIAAIILNALDPGPLANFWAAATDWPIVRDEPAFASLRSLTGRGPWLEFLRVPALPPGKNRVHLDLAPRPGESQTAAVSRLLALGASHVDIEQGDAPWTVLADPEGNEFCVLTPR